MQDDLRNDQSRAREFLELYSSCQSRLYVYIVTLIGNHWDAYDILQDTNLVLWQKFEQFEQGTSFMAWAREVARYRVLRYRQLHANDTPTLEPSVLDVLAGRLDGIDERYDSAYGVALPDCIEKLSDGDRELIALRYGNGTAVKTIAERLHRSVNGVSQSLGRIRRLLRTCMEEATREQASQ
jgi:RNA polymerase sigma-70 factor (ECF subfamily)